MRRLRTPCSRPSCWRGAISRDLRDVERYDVWLHRLLVNACYEESRRQRRWTSRIRVLPLDGPASPDPTVSVVDRDLIERAFARLTPQHRAVFVLHHYAGLPLGTISEVVGVPVGTVKSRLHHATRSLRAAIAADSITDSAEIWSA